MAGASTQGNTDASTANAGQLDPDAFKKLYPESFYQKFIESGIRPDGRVFGRARPTTIGLGAVETADSSALVKIGSTTVLAAIKLEVG
jgi:exosome complex component RRP43